MISMIKAEIRKSRIYALDLETTGLDPLTDRILGIALSTGEPGKEEAWYVDVSDGREYFDKFALDFAEVFNDPELTIVCHNLKFDKSFLHSYGTWPKNKMIDTMIASHMIDENTGNGLKACVLREFGYKMTTFEEVGGLFSKDLDEYAKDDAKWTLKLWRYYEPMLKEQDVLEGFHSIEMPLLDSVIEMERTGITVDSLRLMELGREFSKNAILYETRICEHAGRGFDVSSPEQLSKILYDLLKLPKAHLKPGKKPGIFPTDDKALESLLKIVPEGSKAILKYVQDYREMKKLVNTYTTPLLEATRSDTLRVHSHFWQTGTDTGRFSSSDPVNLQNIPRRSEHGNLIRSAFKAAPGHKLIVSDFSNIELRILAHASMEPSWIHAFHAGRDVHKEVSQSIGCTRDMAKTISFGLVYGMGVPKLARTLNISIEAAQRLMNDYFEKLPQIKNYISAIHQITVKNGWVRNLITHRRRHFKEIDDRALRQSVNFIIQSTAADLMKKAMVDIQGAFRKMGIPAKILMTIHDEVVIEAPEPVAVEASVVVRTCMENAWSFVVPTPCSLVVCDNWKEGK